MLKGGGRPIYPRLFPLLRLKNGSFQNELYLWSSSVWNRRSGLGGSFPYQRPENKPVYIYGNGKQVRDILFVEDLVDAFQLAHKNIDKLQGEVFNIGGGPKNTVSLLEILNLIKEKAGKEMKISFEDWRTGDQQYYVSNTSKFQEATGWAPKYSVDEGVEALMRWLCDSRNIDLPETLKPSNAIAI